jgi:hypothetical protein
VQLRAAARRTAEISRCIPSFQRQTNWESNHVYPGGPLFRQSTNGFSPNRRPEGRLPPCIAPLEKETWNRGSALRIDPTLDLFPYVVFSALKSCSPTACNSASYERPDHRYQTDTATAVLSAVRHSASNG